MSGKVAVVTGAARGFGRACAVRLAEEGAALMLLDIGVVTRLQSVPYLLASAADLEQTASLARERGATVMTRYVDVRDGSALRAAVDAVRSELTKIDIAVSAASVVSSAQAWEISEVQWRTVLDINLGGAWQMARVVAPAMIAQGAGSIVFVGSPSAYSPTARSAHEAAATHGVLGMARTFATELAPHGVRANVVSVRDHAPSVAGGTGPGAGSPDDARPLRRARIDVANTVLFLASDESRGISGAGLVVDPAAPCVT